MEWSSETTLINEAKLKSHTSKTSHINLFIMYTAKKLVSAATLALILSVPVISWAQEKTKEEVKAEREQLKTEMKSEAAKERQAKIAKLMPPKTSGVKSVDDLAVSSAALVVSTNQNNKTIPELYTRTIGESIDGVADVTVKKPTLEELTTVSKNIAIQIAAVSTASAGIQAASADATKASPLQAGKASKAMNYTKDALSLLGPELQLQSKVVNNLISTVKTSKNY
jgi:hypothetical protein